MTSIHLLASPDISLKLLTWSESEDTVQTFMAEFTEVGRKAEFKLFLHYPIPNDREGKRSDSGSWVEGTVLWLT